VGAALPSKVRMKKTVTLGLVALAIGSSVGIVAAEPDGRHRGRNGLHLVLR